MATFDVLSKDGTGAAIESLDVANQAERSLAEAKAVENMGVKWLDAFHDHMAGVKVLSQHLALGDINGDGDWNLIIGDIGRKLKVYKGTSLLSENVLMDVPVAVDCFFMDKSIPRIPAIAVAASNNIFVYKNMRPFYRFTLPTLDVLPAEAEIWQQIVAGKVEIWKAQEKLAALRDGNQVISSRSLDLISMKSTDDASEFVKRMGQIPLVRETVITTLTHINKTTEDVDAVGCLVVGTEAKQLLILNSECTNVIKKIALRGVPARVDVTGLLEGDYRIFVALRDNCIVCIKNGELLSSIIELDAAATAIQRVDKHLFVATMEGALHCYSLKGKKLNSLYIPSPVTNLCMFTERLKGVHGLITAHGNGQIRMYNEGVCVSVYQTKEVITAMKFGQYSREQHALVLAYKSGGVSVKILPRKVEFSATSVTSGPPPEQDVPLNVPRKTKLFIEQMEREKETANVMHQTFQRDLCRLRLNTARNFVKLLDEAPTPVSITHETSLAISAQVAGMGPRFTIRLLVENPGTQLYQKCLISVMSNPMILALSQHCWVVPLIAPGGQYEYFLEVENIDAAGASSELRFVASCQGNPKPLVATVLTMPTSELGEMS
jgi:Bardet-Biedl syndrome 1 protein